MTSVVSICNLALSAIGAASISSLSEASAQARACNQFYTTTVDMLLSSYPWRFATVTASLAEVTNTKAGEWAHAYQLPADCLKVLSIRRAYTDAPDVPPEIDAIVHKYGLPYDIEGGVLYCDLTPALLVHVRRITDPTRYSPLFIEALAWHLAARMAMNLTKDPAQRKNAWEFARMMQVSAQVNDANEVRDNTDIVSEFEGARA